MQCNVICATTNQHVDAQATCASSRNVSKFFMILLIFFMSSCVCACFLLVLVLSREGGEHHLTIVDDRLGVVENEIQQQKHLQRQRSDDKIGRDGRGAAGADELFSADEPKPKVQASVNRRARDRMGGQRFDVVFLRDES